MDWWSSKLSRLEEEGHGGVRKAAWVAVVDDGNLNRILESHDMTLLPFASPSSRTGKENQGEMNESRYR